MLPVRVNGDKESWTAQYISRFRKNFVDFSPYLYHICLLLTRISFNFLVSVFQVFVYIQGKSGLLESQLVIHQDF